MAQNRYPASRLSELYAANRPRACVRFGEAMAARKAEEERFLIGRESLRRRRPKGNRQSALLAEDSSETVG